MARLYIGTWKKYNAGNIAGAWVNLENCANYADFLNKCKAIHKDETDPEFMVQDFENLPEGLGCGEWISKKEFDDIKTAINEEKNEDLQGCNIIDYSAKAIAIVGNTKPFANAFRDCGGRWNARLTCGAGWIFPKTRAEAVRAILASKPGTVAEKPIKLGFDDCTAEYIQTLPERDREYYKKSTAAVVKLNGGFFVISRPSIKNRFCFSDEGPEYEFYKSLRANSAKLENYFISENLGQLDRTIERIKARDVWATVPGYHKHVDLIYTDSWGWERERENGKQLTEPEKEQIIKALEFVREGFKKRLNTYLKKYGTTKLHMWSYWVDA